MNRRPIPSLTTCGTSVPNVFARNPSIEKMMNPKRNDVMELTIVIIDASLQEKRHNKIKYLFTEARMILRDADLRMLLLKELYEAKVM